MTDTDNSLRIEPQPWMTDPATSAVLEALAAGGAQARFVGGSVRDALLGQLIGDIDLATPAPPERVIELLEKRGIKVVPTGLAHGTVTAIAGTPPRHFELTTLRRDVETYGRRARVAFDADWAADAARRDFTINAISLDPDGTVHDPVGGLADLRVRRVRFVGDPATRIAEDVLRIMRYYRFEARFGAGLGDAPARAACRALAHLLPNLSAERVAQELVKLLETSDPVGALRMMAEDSVLPIILPEARRLDRLRHMIASESEPDPLRRLAALIEVDGAGAVTLAERLHFSNAWRDRLHGLAPPWAIDPPADSAAQRRALYRLGAERYRDIALLLAAEGAMSRDRLAELLALARDWTPPAFPLSGRDVTALGIPPGPGVGRLLHRAHEWWEAGDFTAGRAACLVYLKALAAAHS
ncbi:MAG TPA: CCA tRNA nucleotidyltransferase [Stellaceae bacterium]|nr:CCA tRNA nucleotidyltransferase [Stellaceae bacterium]